MCFYPSQNVSPVMQGALRAETVPCARRINTPWATRCRAGGARMDPPHPATQGLLASEAVVSKAGFALGMNSINCCKIGQFAWRVIFGPMISLSNLQPCVFSQCVHERGPDWQRALFFTLTIWFTKPWFFMVVGNPSALWIALFGRKIETSGIFLHDQSLNLVLITLMHI